MGITIGMKLTEYTAKKGSMSRSEFSERLADRLCAEAIDTPSITQVANRCRIPVRTLYNWLTLGREGDPRFAKFAMDFARARGTHEDKWLENVEDVAGLDDPRAANAKLRANEFLLKKHFPKAYGDKVSVTAVSDNSSTTFNLSVLSTPQLRHLHTMLRAVRADNEGDDQSVRRLLSEIPIDVQED